MARVTDWRVILNTEKGLNAMFGYPEPIPPGVGYSRVFGVKLEPGTVEELVAVLREAGARAVISALDNETVYGRRIEPEYIAEIVQRYPEDFIGFAGADPHKGMAAVREMERAVKSYGFKGVDVQPMIHCLPINDARYYPIYAKAQELDIVLFVACSVHFNPDAPLDVQHPAHLDRVAIHFPELKIVARHAGWPWIAELIAVAWRHPNIYLELSGIRPRHLSPELLGYVDSLFQERTVWGSGYPIQPMKRNIEEFKSLSLKEVTKEKVLYHNSARLLGLAD